MKLYVLYNIFVPMRRASKWNARRLKYQPVFNFFVATVLLAIWIGVVGFTPEPLQASAIDGLQAGEGVELLQCPRNQILEQLFALFAIILIVICVYMSYQTRHISGAFSEARFNLLTGYNLVVFGFFAFFVVQNAGVLTPSEQALYIGIAIAWVTFVSSGLIVGTRLYAAMMGYDFDTQEAIIKSRLPVSGKIARMRQASSTTSGGSKPRNTGTGRSSRKGTGTGSRKGSRSGGRDSQKKKSQSGEGSNDTSHKSLSKSI